MKNIRGAISVTEALIVVILVILIVYLLQNVNFH